MKKISCLLSTVSCLILAQAAFAQELTRDIDSVVVVARRPLAEIGMQQTTFDEGQLRASVALSLAEVLGQGSNLFIKSAGRATMATASLRGTQASDLQVVWNGMSLNSPMMGMVDFSYIPSYFVDRARVYSGASSMGVTGGGLGGAVELATVQGGDNGLKINYIQGIGSWCSFDEFLNIGYGGGRWSGSTRASVSTSRNDFPYTNYDRKEFVTDDNGLIINAFYPRERNRNGSFCDIHALQEFQYRSAAAGNFSAAAWWMTSRRGIPMLSVSYYDDAAQSATQSEQTLRAVANWALNRGRLHFAASGGYAYSDLLYLATLTGGGVTNESSHAQSYTHTVYGSAEASAAFSDNFYGELTGRFTQYFVRTADFARLPSLPTEPLGYVKQRAEMNVVGTLRWRPVERLGVAGTVRSEVVGEQAAPLLAALFADWLAIPIYNMVVKASVASNYRFPSLNDLYYRPGGNPALRPEHGLTADAGVEFRREYSPTLTFGGQATVYISHITDWIVWRPTIGGFFTPTNIALVESTGVELSGSVGWQIAEHWHLDAAARGAYTRAKNMSETIGDADRSAGGQLPYIPRVTASAEVNVKWCAWEFGYQFSHYSRRFTTTDNSFSVSGSLPPYYMSDVSVGRTFGFRAGELAVRFTVRNLLGEEYVSILSRPMPGRNFEVMLSFTPHF